MQSIHDIAAQIAAREGGFVDDPDDPGGATNHGVTLTTLRHVAGGGPKTGLAELKALTPAQAADIFVHYYFKDPHLDRLPQQLQPSVFDMYVNAGANAVVILQRLLTRMGFPCTADGVVGPQTETRAQAAARAAPDHLVDAYGIARRNYYYRLGDLRPTSRRYCRRRDGGKGGWIVRAEDFIAPRYRLSAAQHRERTAAWG